MQRNPAGEKTISSITTDKSNRYIYSHKIKQFFLCHPILFELIMLHQKGIDLKKWIRLSKSKDICLRDGKTYSRKEILYQYKKYLLLLNNGYFQSINLENRINGKLDAELLKSVLVSSNQIVFEVTTSCNLKCTYCAYRELYEGFDKRENKNLNIDIAINLIEYIYKYWDSELNRSLKKKINIGFYGGEPLLNFSFIKDIIEYLENLKSSSTHLSFTYGMTTNGLNLNKYMDYLVAKNFDLLISLDGNKKNNDYRLLNNGKSSFDLVMKNLKILRKRYPKYFDTKVNFNAVIHDKNSVEDVYRFFAKHFSKIPRISEVNFVGIKRSKENEYSKIHKNIAQDIECSLNKDILEKKLFAFTPKTKAMISFLLRYCNYVFKDYNELIFPIKEQSKIPSGTCIPFSRKIYLTADGKLLPCERVKHHHYLGTVNENGVSLCLECISNRYNDLFLKMKEKCGMCNFSLSCSQCLFDFNSLSKKNKSFNCPIFKDRDNFSKYLSKRLSHLEENPELFSKIFNGVIVI